MGVKGNTVVLISWNAACQRAGSTGTKPNAFSPPSTTTTTIFTLPLFSLSHERHVPSPTAPYSPRSSLSLPQPMKQESRHLRFLRQDQRSFCPGLRTDGIPSPCCCCCCWPAVAPGIQNRSLTSAWLLEYADVPGIKGTQRIDTCTLYTLKTQVKSFIDTATKVHSNTEILIPKVCCCNVKTELSITVKVQTIITTLHRVRAFK